MQCIIEVIIPLNVEDKKIKCLLGHRGHCRSWSKL